MGLTLRAREGPARGSWRDRLACFRDLESAAADIAIVGSGGVRLKAMQTANVSIMGSGDVVVTGPARCSVSKMGSGDVRCETRS